MKKILVIQGPTASGKTALAVALGKHLNTEVISADSRQFYRELQIGTARPQEHELQGVPHHFLGSHSLFEPISAAVYEREALTLTNQLFESKDKLILVGGSGLYIDALCKGFDPLPHDPELKSEISKQWQTEGLGELLRELQLRDPSYYAQVDRNNPARIIRAIEVIRLTQKPYSVQRTNTQEKRSFEIISWVIDLPRTELYERINDRVGYMIQNGLEEEAMRFMEHRHLQALRTVGYQEYYQAAEAKKSFHEVPDLIRQHTRNYAKRQLTWFRRDPESKWLKSTKTDEQLAEIILKMSEAK